MNPEEAVPGGPGQVDLGARVRWEEDALGRLLVFDCSHNDRDLAFALFHAFQTQVRSEPEGSVRVLADFTEAYHELELTRLWKEEWPSHNRQIKKFAAVGVGGTMTVVFAIYRYYAQFRGSDVDAKLRLFPDNDSAKAWLLES